MERGVGAPSLVMMVRVCDALGVGAGTLLDGVSEGRAARPAVQHLLSVSRELPDDAVAVLIAAAKEMRERWKL